MRNLAAIAVASMLFASVASAQMKVQQPPQSQAPGSPIVIQSSAQPALQVQAEQSLESARRIPRAEAIKLVKEGKAVFVDVRPKESYLDGHIKGAYSLPLGELLNRLGELPPHKFIITYCA